MTKYCSQCTILITSAEYNYSTNYFKKALCFNCQQKERIATVNPKYKKQLEKIQQKLKKLT